jgi:hypothetical protein
MVSMMWGAASNVGATFGMGGGTWIAVLLMVGGDTACKVAVL